MSKVGFRRAMLPALIVGLGVCSTIPGGIPSVAFAQSTIDAPVRNLKENQTILRAQVGFGKSAVVFINNHRVPEGPNGDYAKWVDISRYVRPGQNTVRIEVEG